MDQNYKIHILFLSGTQPVYIKIFDADYNNESVQLSAGLLTDQLHGILCENGQ